MGKIRKSVKRVLTKLGYRVIRADQPHVGFENFVNLAVGYEGRLEAADGVQLGENPLRHRLLGRLQGTPPTEAYEIIEALVRTRSLEGDVCEFGVAQGETSALIANEIRDHDKTLHLFDSFQGLSAPTEHDVLKDDVSSLGDMKAYAGAMSWAKWSLVSRLEAVSFPRRRYRIHEGFIEDVLRAGQGLPSRVSFAYVDFDLYAPIKAALEYLDRVTASGAILIVDDYDYFSTGAKTAVDQFVETQNAESARYSIRVPPKRYGHFAVLTRV